MARCEACGNDYDGVQIAGHGLDKSGRMFCCAHCAAQAGVKELRDRA